MKKLRTNLTFALSQESLRKSVLFDPLGRVGKGVLLLRNLRDNPASPVVTVVPIVVGTRIESASTPTAG